MLDAQQQVEGVNPADNLIQFLVKLQQQAQAFQQTSSALSQILPSHTVAQITASLQHPSFGVKPTTQR